MINRVLLRLSQLRNKRFISTGVVARAETYLPYRLAVDAEKSSLRKAELFGGFVWWYLLYNFYHNYESVIGHGDMPDPSTWTDKELGIPSDTEDI